MKVTNTCLAFALCAAFVNYTVADAITTTSAQQLVSTDVDLFRHCPLHSYDCSDDGQFRCCLIDPHFAASDDAIDAIDAVEFASRRHCPPGSYNCGEDDNVQCCSIRGSGRVLAQRHCPVGAYNCGEGDNVKCCSIHGSGRTLRKVCGPGTLECGNECCVKGPFRNSIGNDDDQASQDAQKIVRR